MKTIRTLTAASTMALLATMALAATPASVPAAAPSVLAAGDCDKSRRDEPPDPTCEERKKRCAWLKPCPKRNPPAARDP